MRWITFIIFLILITLLNASNVLNFIAIGQWSIRPDILIIIFVFFAVNSDPADAIVASFMIGFAADISLTDSMGLFMTAFGLAGIFLAQLKRNTIDDRLFNQFALMFVAAIAIQFFAATIAPICRLDRASEPLAYIAMKSLYTSLAALPLWYILNLISPLFGIERLRPSNI